jgi:hypothetical protein
VDFEYFWQDEAIIRLSGNAGFPRPR